MTLDELDPEEEQEAAEGYASDVSDRVEEWMAYREELFEYLVQPPSMQDMWRKSFLDPEDYRRIHGKVEEDIDVTYSERDVEEFVLRNLDEEYEKWQQLAVGVFTSSLVHLLTEETEEETGIYVNGGGNRFDYLFYGMRKADTVVVEDVRGKAILRGAGSYGGEIGTVVLDGVEGWRAGSEIAFEGRAGTVVLNAVVGNTVATGIGGGEKMRGVKDNYLEYRAFDRGGDIDLLVLSGVDRSMSPNSMGMGGCGGRIRNLVLDDIELADGYQMFTGRHGYVGTALFRDIRGEMDVEAGELVDLDRSDRFEDVEGLLDGMRSGGSLLQDVERLEEVLDLSWPRRLKRWVQWAV